MIEKLNAAHKSEKGRKRKESSVGEMLRDAAMVGMPKRKKDSDSEMHDLTDDSSDHQVSRLVVKPFDYSGFWFILTSS